MQVSAFVCTTALWDSFLDHGRLLTGEQPLFQGVRVHDGPGSLHPRGGEGGACTASDVPGQGHHDHAAYNLYRDNRSAPTLTEPAPTPPTRRSPASRPWPTAPRAARSHRPAVLACPRLQDRRRRLSRARKTRDAVRRFQKATRLPITGKIGSRRSPADRQRQARQSGEAGQGAPASSRAPRVTRQGHRVFRLRHREVPEGPSEEERARGHWRGARNSTWKTLLTDTHIASPLRRTCWCSAQRALRRTLCRRPAVTFTRAESAGHVDHTLLKPEATPAEVAALVAEARELARSRSASHQHAAG